MANYSTLIADITAKIYENAGNDITGQDLQDVLLEMVTEMGQSGMVCLGIADGNTNPPGSSDSNIFYIAGEGTYSNFGGLTVNAGEIALFIWDGATWQKQSVTTTDPNKADKVAGATAGDLAGLDGSGNLTDSGVPSNNVAQQDGYYSTLTAGSAENLIGRGTVPAEYTRRTSGGSADIGSGAATIAKIHGNTIVWNQMLDYAYISSTSNAGFTLSKLGDNKLNIYGTSTATTALGITPNMSFRAGHKYLLQVPKINTNVMYRSTNWTFDVTVPANDTRCIFTCPSDTTEQIILRTAAGVSVNADYYPMLIDLTVMGLDTLTVSEFTALFPLQWYDYNNTGSLVSLTGTGIETNGFNQWDEEWESGVYSNNGTKSPLAGYFRNVNPIPVFPSTTYGFTKPSGEARGFFYDVDGQFIRYVVLTNATTFTTNANEYYFNFYHIGATYNHDICINLSWSGYRNGEYEAYWDSTLALPITTVTSGGSAVFSDGMKSAGSVYDELTSTKAVKRIAKLDLGTLNWSMINDMSYPNRFTITISAMANNGNNIIPNYANKGVGGYGSQIAEDKSYDTAAGTTLQIHDSAYSDAATFKTAMSGVYLYYELATPVEYTLDSEVNLNYRVDDFGTETLLPQNNATPTTAPIVYDVRYAMNAVDTLRNLPKNYIGKDSMEHILNALVTAGVISAYTLSWNATNENYDCTITA